MTFLDKINETAAFLKEKGIQAPEFGLILGSGLGELAEEIEHPVVVDYAEIPNWGRSTVVGHAGKLVYGELAGRKVLVLQGRFHFYEGNPLEVVTFPVRVMKVLGCEGVIVTNAAGGISFGPGTLMAISDHINMTGQNPLMGENLDDFGPRFPDMSKAYTPEYRATAHEVAKKLGIKLEGFVVMVPRRGTYVANISLKDITQVFEIRSALEELAAGLAAERITSDEIETLERMLVEIGDYMENKDMDSAVSICV